MTEVDDPTRWSFGDQHFDVLGNTTHKLWETDTFTSDLLPAATAFTEADPRWRDPHRIRTYTLEGEPPDRVTLAVHLRPFPLDVARELVVEEGVDPAVVDAIPTFTLASASLEWTPAVGRSCVFPPLR